MRPPLTLGEARPLRRSFSRPWLPRDLPTVAGLIVLLGAVVLPEAFSAQPPRRELLPVPTAEAQQKAEVLIRDLYHLDAEGSSLPSQKQELAKKLYEEAEQTEDDPTGRFVLLKLACKLATEVGDARLIDQSIDRMARHFSIDAAGIKKTMISRAVENPRNSAVARQLAEDCLALMDQAVKADRYDAALDYGRAAHTAAGKAKAPSLVSEVVARGRQVVELREAFQQVVEATKRLAEDPDDPEANLVRGRHLCLIKANWRRGLPMLAKGSDPALKDAAQRDLAQPATTAEQMAVADTWWEMAKDRADPIRKSLRDRAARWYIQAKAQASGLDKTKAMNRLAEWKGFARSKKPPVRKPDKPKRPASDRAPPKTLDIEPGQWAEVLDKINPKKNRIAGNWQFRGGKLTAVPAAGSSAGIVIPVVPRGSYDLQIELTRTAGDGLIGVVLPVGHRQCLAVLDCRPGVHGLDTIDGRRADANDSTARGALTTGRRYRLDISVSTDGTEAAITVNLDDRPLFFYRGAANSLALHKDFTTRHRTALALVARCGVVFHGVKLRMKSGKAMLLP